MQHERGFTLIEVLIAAVILFTVIAVASQGYTVALGASRRAERVVELLTPLPLITNNVRNAIRASRLPSVDGDGELLGVRYRFEARTAAFGAPPARFDPDVGQFREYRPRIRLYDVALTLRRGDVARRYSYQELSWDPAER
jgi:prepilin-type N-terminal cleavage/methylation domain-containing protein